MLKQKKIILWTQGQKWKASTALPRCLSRVIKVLGVSLGMWLPSFVDKTFCCSSKPQKAAIFACSLTRDPVTPHIQHPQPLQALLPQLLLCLWRGLSMAVPVIAGDKARWPRRPLAAPFNDKTGAPSATAAWVRPRSNRLCAGETACQRAQWSWCFTLDEATAGTIQVTHYGPWQRWATGHGWWKREGSLHQGNEIKSLTPVFSQHIVELTNKLQVQQIFIVSLLLLQHQRAEYFLVLFLFNHANTPPPHHVLAYKPLAALFWGTRMF